MTRSCLCTLLATLTLAACEADSSIALSDGRTTASVALDPDDEGRWTTLPELADINPIHGVLLHEFIPRTEREELGRPIGTVLIVSGDGDNSSQTSYKSQIRDFSAGTVTDVDVPFDAFCSGITVPANGNPVIVGGTYWDSGFPEGLSDAASFNVRTRQYVARPHMAHERWYPTATLLGDNRVMVEAGWSEYQVMNSTVEIYTPGVGWSAEFPMGWEPMFYMRKHLLPDGRVFNSGPENLTRMFDPAVVSTTNTGWTEVDWTRVSSLGNIYNREYGTSVLLPLTPENGYNPEVVIMGGFRDLPTDTTERIDLGEANPEWRWGPPMAGARSRMQATLLPDGTVLALGGSSVDYEELFAVLEAEIYDPATELFTPAGVMQYARLDHSIALLLPDATVWVAGSQREVPDYQEHMEVYEPPYLFDPNGTLADRPLINRAPDKLGYDADFTIRSHDAADIGSVVLVRAGAVTHSFNTDQRLVGLEFVPGSVPDTLDVVSPPNSNIAPPGYYMLFLVSWDGVPSVATFVQIR